MRKKSLYNSSDKIASRKTKPQLSKKRVKNLWKTNIFGLFQYFTKKPVLPQRNEASKLDFVTKTRSKQKTVCEYIIIPRFYTVAHQFSFIATRCHLIKNLKFLISTLLLQKKTCPKPSSSTFSKLSMQKLKSKAFAMKLFEKYQ